MLHDLLHDTRFGLRNLGKAPGFAAVALLTLALGIGANAAIFSVLNGVVLEPLPYRDSVELVQLWSGRSISPENLVRLRAEADAFAGISGYFAIHGALTGAGDPVELAGATVAVNHFSVLGVSPVLGRGFTPEEQEPDRGHVAIISHGLWQRRFAGDATILGRNIDLVGTGRTVIGVMPEGHRPLAGAIDFWIPQVLDPSNFSEYSGTASTFAVARLAPGVTIDQATAELQGIARQISAEVGGIYDEGWIALATASPLQDAIVGGVTGGLYMLLGAVVCVLLIACANVANLLLARGSAREREIAVRMALGAGRRRVVRQLLTESATLGIAGGALGLGVAWLLLDVLRSWPTGLPRMESVSIDGRVLLFSFGLSIVASLVFGIAPALRVTQGELAGSLKDGGRSSSQGAGRLRLNRGLVVAEIALSVVVMAGAGLLLRSMWQMWQVDLGFDPGRVVTMRVLIPDSSRHATPALRASFFEQIDRRVAELPGVDRAGFVTFLPMTRGLPSATYERPDQPVPEGTSKPFANFQLVTPGYFEAMSIPLTRGRRIEWSDRSDTPLVGVINDALARLAFGEEDPLGKRIVMFGGGADFTVVGVVSGSRQYRPDREPQPEVYIAYDQLRWLPSMFLTVRTHADPRTLASEVREAIWAVDRNVPISEVQTMESIVSGSTGETRMFASLLLGFGGLALLLGAIGVYGVLSYVVSQRTHEIGIRIALGADRGQIMKSALGWALRPVLLGVGIGVAGAFAVTRLISGFLYGVGASDPLTFVAVPLLLTIVALSASYLPARRAARTDPLVSMRAD